MDKMDIILGLVNECIDALKIDVVAEKSYTAYDQNLIHLYIAGLTNRAHQFGNIKLANDVLITQVRNRMHHISVYDNNIKEQLINAIRSKFFGLRPRQACIILKQYYGIYNINKSTPYRTLRLLFNRATLTAISSNDLAIMLYGCNRPPVIVDSIMVRNLIETRVARHATVAILYASRVFHDRKWPRREAITKVAEASIVRSGLVYPNYP